MYQFHIHSTLFQALRHNGHFHRIFVEGSTVSHVKLLFSIIPLPVSIFTTYILIFPLAIVNKSLLYYSHMLLHKEFDIGYAFLIHILRQISQRLRSLISKPEVGTPTPGICLLVYAVFGYPCGYLILTTQVQSPSSYHSEPYVRSQ